MNPVKLCPGDSWRSTHFALKKLPSFLRQLASLRTTSDRACQSRVCDLLHYAAWITDFPEILHHLGCIKTLQTVG